MKNMMLIGFSVTEMPTSYVPILRDILGEKRPDIGLRHCGIGGATIEDLSYVVDDILTRAPETTHVIFEISTGNGRHEYRAKLAQDPKFLAVLRSRIEHLILTCFRRGLPCGFIGFPRKEIPPLSDFVDAAIAQTCELYGVPFVWVGGELANAGVNLDTILYDVVHPSPTGADWYAQRAFALVEQVVDAYIRPSIWPSTPRYGAIRIADLDDGPAISFTRHGFSADYVELTPDAQIMITLPRPIHVAGIIVLAGPTGGLLTVHAAASHQHLFYDEYCYYQRVMTTIVNLGLTTSLIFHLSPEVPEISLLKGEKDFGPRKLGLFYLLHDELV